ncbi:MAG TPA: hypothetical protein VNZ05_00070, partial [Solirubrobacteraceae bacterium]|nr:hypothetical protein [Solirubrobacteraceae bacterium]
MAQRSAAKRHAPGTRRSRGRGAAIAAAALLLALSAFSALGHGESLEGDDPSARAASATGHSAGGPVQPVAVLFDLRRRGRPVKPGFLGLSFEVASLPQIARYDGGGNFIKLLRSLGPGVLRFGGASADTRIAWSDASTPTPAWASGVLTESDLRALAKVASSSGWRVLLTLGLAHYEPLAAAHEAGAARAALGSTLAGIELGNEPDAYANHALREEPWTFAQYDGQAHGYLGAIRAQAPGIPLAGPDVSGSAAFIDWGSGEARLRPQLLTGHHYPLGCHEVPGPSIERLLSAETRQAEDVSLARYMRVARADGIAFRLDETNSVSCGGRAGVSDTFASALWAVSYIARAMAAGVSGINFHDDPANCRGYAPLCALTAARLGSGALSARPEWYAL